MPSIPAIPKKQISATPLLKRAWRYLLEISENFDRHETSLMAAACAYGALLSLIPLLLLIISLYGFFLGNSNHALNSVIHSVQNFIPIRSDFLRKTLTNALHDKRIIGLFGFIGLLYASHQTFLTLESSMSKIWDAPEGRIWWKKRLIAIGATFLTLGLMIAENAAFLLAAILYRKHPFSIPALPALLPLRILATLLPPGIAAILFYSLYNILPAANVTRRAALVGALIAAPLWEISRILFSLFIVMFHSYDRLYGSLGSLVALVIWAYYSMVILLLGAEISADYEKKKKKQESGSIIDK